MRKILITIIASTLVSASAYAGGVGIGVTGSFLKIDGNGTETTTAGDVGGGAANTNTASASNDVVIGKAYIEYSLEDVSYAASGITFGVEAIPGGSDVSDKTKTRSETAEDQAGSGSSGSVTYSANAEVENYVNYYVEIPLYASVYVKAGMAEMDVITNEDADHHGSYGNTSLDGTNLGIGIKGTSGNYQWKLAYETVDFDTLNLTSTTSNKIKADLDTEELNFSVGYVF